MLASVKYPKKNLKKDAFQKRQLNVAAVKNKKKDNFQAPSGQMFGDQGISFTNQRV